MSKTCRFCKTELLSDGDFINYNCPECGNYKIYFQDRVDLSVINSIFSNKPKIMANLHNIRGFLKEREPYTIDKNNLEYIIDLKNLKIREKLYKMLFFLHKNSNTGELFNITFKLNKVFLAKGTLEINLNSVAWSENEKEVEFLLDDLLKNNLLEELGSQSLSGRMLRVTGLGIDTVENFGNVVSNIGFCAMWFDKSMEEAWFKAISLAIKDAGYLSKRIDKHDHNNVIIDEVEGLITQSRFVIADLTGHRGGVYYEAGFAKALNRPVIFTCEADSFEDIHFDVKHVYCMKWYRNDLTGFKNELENKIVNILGPGKF